ncbi:16s rrna methyltransferase [Lasius niger]|uniref:16s rrna methyltransferase n=1 Tax=Lasius niger TaxID=67767 RepID=A0A0J7K9W2_LASNI|nr:16s rrna methyltransferase [Lasius niger]
MACSAILLMGCQANSIAHTNHNERTIQAKTAFQVLSKRYQQLKTEETKVASFECPSVKRTDDKAQKAVSHLQANAVHPHEGQSVLHIPTHLDIENAEEDLDALSAAIEECQGYPKAQTQDLSKETL